jgi:quercetin dioxygenase-like cupin family protein
MPIGPSSTNTFEVLLHQNPTIAPGSCGMVATVTIPPGDPGSGPHRHSGPVFGYVLEGEILFELEGESPYPIKAGEAFWEPGFDVVHYQAANLRDDIASKFVVFMLCAPDVPMMTYLDEEEIAARAHLRRQSSRAAVRGAALRRGR